MGLTPIPNTSAHPPGTKYTIANGNPADGIQMYGLFDTFTAAAEFGNEDGHIEGDWWVMPIYPHGEDQTPAEPQTQNIWAVSRNGNPYVLRRYGHREFRELVLPPEVGYSLAHLICNLLNNYKG